MRAGRGAPLRATTSAAHLPGEFNQQSVGGLWRPRAAQRDPSKRDGRGTFRPVASRSMRFADVFNGATWEISVYLDLDTGEVN